MDLVGKNILKENILKDYRVGILTFHFVDNYGAVIQAKSLQLYLNIIGANCEIINVAPFLRPKLYLYLGLKNFRRSLHAILSVGSQLEKRRKFYAYRKNLLMSSKSIEQINDCELDLSSYSHVIVGSDQVWNPKYGMLALKVYSLECSNDHVERISYAACVGSALTQASELLVISGSLGKFKYISVRDKFSERVIRELLGNRRIYQVLDPTFLVNWKEEIGENLKISPILEDYIFVYGFSNEIGIIINDLKLKNPNICVIATGMEAEFFFRPDVIHKNDLGPDEFLEMIINAKAVVTKSFHGLALAINMRKEVYVPVLEKSSSDRITDLCDRLEIDSGYFINYNMDGKNFSILHIDCYDEIEPILNREIGLSKEFLKMSLGYSFDKSIDPSHVLTL
jgi:hypothetical protein